MLFKILAVIFPIISFGIILYSFNEAKNTAYGVTPRYYLSSIPYVIFIFVFEIILLTSHEVHVEFLNNIKEIIDHDTFQTILVDLFLICGIKYFLTGNGNNMR